MIKIDYYGGSYGNFLAYILNRYIFKIPSANFDPITDIGASHYKTTEYQTKRIGIVKLQLYLNNNKNFSNFATKTSLLA
jgi:hypothetical protein